MTEEPQPATPRPNCVLAGDLFLRALGLVYLIAFVSFGVQIKGLIGSDGILPLPELLNGVRNYYGASAYHLLPTVLWISSSNGALTSIWILGSACSILLIVNVFRRAACAACFLLYLSLVTTGQVFMGYQWDALLLEAGFLAIFLGWSPWIIWMYRWLLFRLMFMSGAVKILSHDLSWRGLEAMKFHYQTQPIPTPVAWYAQQLPPWFQQFTTGVVLFIEIFIPFLIFLPHRARKIAAGIFAAFQMLIILTGNYAFFNILSIALCLFLIDDAAMECRFPARLLDLSRNAVADWNTHRRRRIAAGVVSVVILVVSVFETAERLFGFETAPTNALIRAIAPFEITNTYGLFAVMTTTRPEIVIEGSNDEANWLEYEFKYKPGDVKRRPPWVAPHQPRLDWQMWFAALGSYREAPWILAFELRLLQGSPDVLRLLQRNPYPSSPPHYLRAQLYEYRFSTFQEKRQTGDWWHRELRGTYLPPLSLEDFAKTGVR